MTDEERRARVRESVRKYRENHPEEWRAIQRKWQRANREKLREYQRLYKRKYRARKKEEAHNDNLRTDPEGE